MSDTSAPELPTYDATVYVNAFLVRVSFPARESGSANVAEAYLHLVDDADAHRFRIAVPRELAMVAVERLREAAASGNELEGAPTIRVGIALPGSFT